MKSLIIEMPADAHRKLRYAAFVRGASMKSILMECVDGLPEPPPAVQPSRTTEDRAPYSPERPKPPPPTDG